MKLIYSLYKLNSLDKPSNKSNMLAEALEKRIDHILKELIKKDSLFYPLAIRYESGFIFTKLVDDFIYFIYSDTNPYCYLNSKIIKVDNDYLHINKSKPNALLLNNLDDDMYDTIENIIQALIDNIDNNKSIYLDEFNIDSLLLILSLIPNSYLSHIEYS